MRNIIFALSLLAPIGLQCVAYADPPKGSDIAGVITVYPRHGGEHHAFIARDADESLDSMFDKAFTACGDEHCRIATVFQKGDCVGLAKGKTYVYWNWTQGEEEKARKLAMDSCNRSSETCEIEKSICFPK